ncbi:MAG: hypothetical protein Q8P36_00005 [bacterium]|nr:hypothetical protein [bacterium]
MPEMQTPPDPVPSIEAVVKQILEKPDRAGPPGNAELAKVIIHLAGVMDTQNQTINRLLGALNSLNRRTIGLQRIG